MTYIDTYKHSCLGDFRTETHTPEITANFGIHLTDDVHENSVVVLCNSSVCNELRNDNDRIFMNIMR
jgi:hypothetical protein